VRDSRARYQLLRRDGAVSRLWHGKQERVATGLPSVVNLVPPGDVGGTARHRVRRPWQRVRHDRLGRGSCGARGSGRAWVAVRDAVKLEPSGQWRVVADVAAYEGAANPAGGPRDTNPYGLLAEPGREFVTDAGGNDLLQVASNGDVSLVAVLPPIAAPSPFLVSDPVPTEVERGPDGALYVSELTEVPFLAGSAGIYRIVPGQAPQLYAGGFKTIIDFAWGGLRLEQRQSHRCGRGAADRTMSIAVRTV
jgi:hypothetical protein